jgi:hypothetical protein
MNNYQSVKAKVIAEIEPTEHELYEAISDQTDRLAAIAGELSLHTAKLAASAYHPWPLPEDQEGRIFRRALRIAHEHERLTRLYFWLELQKNKIGIGSIN